MLCPAPLQPNISLSKNVFIMALLFNLPKMLSLSCSSHFRTVVSLLIILCFIQEKFTESFIVLWQRKACLLFSRIFSRKTFERDVSAGYVWILLETTPEDCFFSCQHGPLTLRHSTMELNFHEGYVTCFYSVSLHEFVLEIRLPWKRLFMTARSRLRKVTEIQNQFIPLSI